MPVKSFEYDLKYRVMKECDSGGEYVLMNDYKALERELLAACEVIKMVEEIERRNNTGLCVSIHYDDNGGYSIGGFPAKPTIREAWEAFEGRQR